MNLKQKRWAVIAALVAGLVLAIWGRVDGRGWMQTLGFAAIAGGIILDLVLLRCPKCGAWLGRYPGRHCGSCGAEIPWDGKQ